MKTQVLSAYHPEAIRHAQEILMNDGLVAFPTDTVYGLAAMVSSAKGIDLLFDAKNRDLGKAIAVLVGHLDQLEQLTPGLTDSARRLAEHFWPGALTLVVPKHSSLPENLSGFPTIGVRMPYHSFALTLLRTVGPLATTSANLSGGVNASKPGDVLAQLGGRFHLLLDGGICPGGVPSTVVDCTQTPPSILREGAIAPQLILDIAKL
jgi:L-threonylcarbamoyladenylate synthase